MLRNLLQGPEQAAKHLEQAPAPRPGRRDFPNQHRLRLPRLSQSQVCNQPHRTVDCGHW